MIRDGEYHEPSEGEICESLGKDNERLIAGLRKLLYSITGNGDLDSLESACEEAQQLLDELE